MVKTKAKLRFQDLPSDRRHALRAGFNPDEKPGLTKIDECFLVQIKEIVDFEEELAIAQN